MPRLRLILAVAVVLAACAWAAITVRILLLPDEGAPAQASAVVVLSGSSRRLGRALKLMEQGVAPVLAISAGDDQLQVQARRLCAAGRGDGYRVLCFRPRPDSTRGEARAVARLAAEYRWRSVVLVTSTFHVTRARILFERCLDARVYAVGASFPWTSAPAAVAGEWAKLAYAYLVARGC